MNKLILAFLALSVCACSAFAGTTSYSGKEMKQTVQQAPCPEWYGDREWNVSLWGAYAFTGTENNRTDKETADDDGILGTYDHFLGGDHAWGGGADVKYFFHRYFGLGVEGFGLAGKGLHLITDHITENEEHYVNEDHGVGGAFGTFTLRYPFQCSRFSPYIWGGVGGVFGGRNDHRIRPYFSTVGVVNDDESRFAGQLGGGLEVRLTRHIGWMGDFAWNFVDGSQNDFGMVRTGLNFAF